MIVPIIAAFLAGAVNAIAGGGSFISFPALVWSGVPALIANATNSAALVPGGLAAAAAFRGEEWGVPEQSRAALVVVSLAGGLAGALLLLATPARGFDAVVPWLLLVGTVTFAFGERLGPVLRRKLRLGTVSFLIVQFALGVYCGYFGAAAGS